MVQESNIQPQSAQNTSSESDLIKDLTIGLPSSIKLFQESLQLFHKKFPSFLGVTAIVIVPLYAMSKIPLVINLQSQILSFLFNFTFIYIMFLVLSFMFLALLFSIKNNEENISIISAYSLAKKHFVEYWKILLLIFGLLFLGKLFFIVPAIILSVSFSISLMVYLVEDLHGMDALLMSKQYIQGYWSSVLLRLIFLAAVFIVLSLPLYFFMEFRIAYAVEAYFLVLLLFMLPVAGTYIFLIYGNLRLLKPKNPELVEALNKTKDIKIKLKLLKPAFINGAVIGLPLVLIFTYLYIFRIFQISGSSMTPTFIDKEFITVNVWQKRSNAYNRGDVVVFQSPVDSKRTLIRRIIGLPQEKFRITQEEIYINDARLDENEYMNPGIKTINGNFLRENVYIEIPLKHYIALGDNRLMIDDSRDWGFIRESDIIGNAGFCIWGCQNNK